MKEFKLIITINENGETNVNVENKGFDAIELSELFPVKMPSIVDQVCEEIAEKIPGSVEDNKDELSV